MSFSPLPSVCCPVERRHLKYPTPQGTASGAVSGDYALDGINSNAEMHDANAKLDVQLDRKSQQLRARLDACPISLDSCSPGNWVTLWEQ
ncbi:MAG TPA: hypothetical protein VN685_04235 [Rhizomicrobium sp.]|nr:hypothetical protein [Rhizomicrobium sp.]